MKKILSLILVISLALSCAVILSSCSGVTLDSVEKEPSKALSTSYTNTMSAFFEDDYGIYDVIGKTAGKSSLELYFESADLLGPDLSSVGATIYSDIENNKFVLDANAKYQSKDLEARLFLDKNGLIATGESVFGNDDTYGIFFSTLDKLISDNLSSANPEIIASVEMVQELFASLEETLNKNAKDLAEEMADFKDGLGALLEHSFAEEEVKVGDEKIACVVISYEITNKTIEELIDNLYDELLKDLDSDGQLATIIDSTLTSVLSSVTVDLTASIAISKATNSFASIELDGKITPLTSALDTDSYVSPSMNVNLSVEFLENKIDIWGYVTMSGQTYNANLVFEKEKKKDSIIYSIELNVGENSKSMEIFSAEFEFTKDKELRIDVRVNPLDGSESTVIVIKGTYDTTPTKASFEITSIKINSNTLTFKLGIIIDKAPEMPETPENAKDISNMTEAEKQQFVSDISNSDIGKIIAAMTESKEPDQVTPDSGIVIQ